MKVFSLKAPNFNLSHTLECGQVFRWDKTGHNEYRGVLSCAVVRIKQDKGRLFIHSSSPDITPSFIKSYFDLNLDLPYIYNKIGKDKHIKGAIKQFNGLRIIKQPFWECLASFIISAYNNIPRIKGIIYRISRCSGQPIPFDGGVNYLFPAPEVFADYTLCRLRQCGTGFRAPYLKKSAQAFLEGKISLNVLRSRTHTEARDILMRLDGVGEKVAECVLLYAAGRLEAFPVDVWIKRIMEDAYFDGLRTGEKKIREFANSYFGEYAGYAQQYLYHYGRSRLKA